MIAQNSNFSICTGVALKQVAQKKKKKKKKNELLVIKIQLFIECGINGNIRFSMSQFSFKGNGSIVSTKHFGSESIH